MEEDMGRMTLAMSVRRIFTSLCTFYKVHPHSQTDVRDLGSG